MEYLSRAEVTELLGISKRTVDRWIDDINSNHKGRYGQFCVIKSRGIVRIDKDTLLDYAQNKRELKDMLEKGMKIPKFRRKADEY